jgi:hypothetical protein
MTFDKMENFESTYESALLNFDEPIYAGQESYMNYLDDSLSFNLNNTDEPNTNNFWKFGENKTLKAVEDYIKSTYNSHYASENSKVQVLDIIDAIGDGVPFCRDNLIKYSSRFGKKDGMSKLDALKIIHYGILLYHFAGFNNETSKSNYETF